ncbi:phage tail protein [Actinacidiphila bryophytorum]|uniref:phage tail protein n=1 Tax=Actinacidiphila bryophytorum TaxID=1436133 RepID=UPI002246E458|nr:phage tail protein [Actinacidiphila bryophytorum]
MTAAGRRLLPGLPTRHPLGRQLPAVYAADAVVQGITQGLDDVLAPVLCTLDNLPAYLDPALAPADFVALLAAWVGADGEADAGRDAVAGAAGSHAVRGTCAGLAEQIRLAFGVTAEVDDGVPALASTTALTPLPQDTAPHLAVRVRTGDPGALDIRALTALVARNRPAHVPFTVEVLGPG